MVGGYNCRHPLPAHARERASGMLLCSEKLVQLLNFSSLICDWILEKPPLMHNNKSLEIPILII